MCSCTFVTYVSNSCPIVKSWEELRLDWIELNATENQHNDENDSQKPLMQARGTMQNNCDSIIGIGQNEGRIDDQILVSTRRSKKKESQTEAELGKEGL